MARVTAIIPTYNRSQLVVQSVASVLAQTYHDLELIVVVDGSTDDTLDRLDALFGSKITVLSQPNQGLPATRNRGILHASGEFVAFLDDDDLWLARKLERQIAYADMHPTVSLIGCQAYWMNLRGRLLRSPRMVTIASMRRSPGRVDTGELRGRWGERGGGAPGVPRPHGALRPGPAILRGLGSVAAPGQRAHRCTVARAAGPLSDQPAGVQSWRTSCC